MIGSRASESVEARTRGSDECWASLVVGSELRVVKRSPEGREVTSYPGIVVEAGAPPSWVAVRATWGPKPVELDGLRFVPGDRLHEFFSPTEWFNAFTVFSPEGELRGWYANVTHPTLLDCGTNPPTLTWPDLYVDLIGLPGGDPIIRDEDELAESGLARTDPDLHARILAVRDDLIDRWAARTFPFHERSDPPPP